MGHLVGAMLYDALIPRSADHGPDDDRRGSARVRVRAELVVLWHHDMQTAVRYRVTDLSDGGAHILSTAPLIRGMTGTAVRLLPKGAAINRLCTVSWIKPPALGGPFEVGLHFS